MCVTNSLRIWLRQTLAMINTYHLTCEVTMGSLSVVHILPQDCSHFHSHSLNYFRYRSHSRSCIVHWTVHCRRGWDLDSSLAAVEATEATEAADNCEESGWRQVVAVVVVGNAVGHNVDSVDFVSVGRTDSDGIVVAVAVDEDYCRSCWMAVSLRWGL